MAHWSRWLAAKRIDLRRLSMTEVERFLTARRRSGYTHYASSKAMAPMLVSLRDQGVVVMPHPTVPPEPIEAVLARYRQYLLQERGLGQATARGYVDAVRPFVRERVHPDGLTLPWASLDAADVMAFVVRHTPNQSRGTAKLTVTALRSLLGFLHVEGLITRSLTAAVPSVAGWRLAGLPKALQPAQIHALLASCDRRTRTGRRDFAVLTILVRLGLRAGEVATLRLDDIDWRAGTIVIRGKGPHVESLPWPSDVGEAVVAYLHRGRPATAVDRTVFVRVKAPHRALSSAGMTEIVAAAARRAGLGVIHAHRLRHTAATQLLRAGAPLAEIGQLLRHRRALTTAVYAKVDHATLRMIARPWPRGVA
jgi:site-specific recombinase XerD